MKAPRNEREAHAELSKPVKHKPARLDVGETNIGKLLLVFVIVLIIAWSIK